MLGLELPQEKRLMRGGSKNVGLRSHANEFILYFDGKEEQLRDFK